MKRKIKRYLFDTAGITLIILGILLGWLPGPGGIPLILGGLGLLAVHNEWAENLIIKFKEKGEDFARIIFPVNRKIQLAHDIIALGLVLLGGYLIISQNNRFQVAIGIPIIILAITEFLFNRRRIDRLKLLAQKIIKKR